MQRQQLRFWLLVGLGVAGLSGCASLKWPGEGGSLSPSTPRATTAPSTTFDPLSQAGSSPSKSDLLASEPSPKNLLEGQFAMARLCERRGEIEQAEQIYSALIEKTPKDARLHHRLGVLALRKGDFARAEQQFNTAKSLAPISAELLSDIGYCYYLQQKLPEAEQSLKEALRLEPTCAAAINNLALVMGREGRFRESLDLFKRTNSEAEAYANLAYVLAQNGDSARAKEFYARALTLDNTMRIAAEAMLQIDQHIQTQKNLASESSESLVVDAPASEPADGPKPPAPTPAVVERQPQTTPSPAAPTPSETCSAEGCFRSRLHAEGPWLQTTGALGETNKNSL